HKTFHALVPRRQKRADKLSMRPVDKLSSATTSQPCSNKALTKLDPINPAAPVTTHRLPSFIGCLAPWPFTLTPRRFVTYAFATCDTVSARNGVPNRYTLGLSTFRNALRVSKTKRALSAI